MLLQHTFEPRHSCFHTCSELQGWVSTSHGQMLIAAFWPQIHGGLGNERHYAGFCSTAYAGHTDPHAIQFVVLNLHDTLSASEYADGSWGDREVTKWTLAISVSLHRVEVCIAGQCMWVCTLHIKSEFLQWWARHACAMRSNLGQMTKSVGRLAPTH